MSTSHRETVLCRYHYDPLDRQATCTPYKQANIQRFYCKSRLATEIQDAVKHCIFQNDDQLLAQQQCQGANVNTTLLATDQQRSILNALDRTRPDPVGYTPYGHRPSDNGWLSLLGFNGERPDPVTGHYHLGNGYRQFNPVLMRFNSPDSWSPFGDGGLNAYAYCDGDPRNWVDETGHAPFPSYVPVHITNKMDKFLKGVAARVFKKPKATSRPVAAGVDFTEVASSSSTTFNKMKMKKLRERVNSRAYNGRLKKLSDEIASNEASRPNHNLYTARDDISGLDIEKDYNRVQQDFGFTKYPDPDIPHLRDVQGVMKLDVRHYDVTISYFKKKSRKYGTNAYRRQIISRDKYIKNFGWENSMDIRQ